MNSDYIYGFGLGLSLLAAIGAQNVHVISHGLRRNHHLLVAFICFLCDVLLIGIGVFGVGKYIFSSILLKKIMLIMGTIFLLYYAFNSLASAFSSSASGIDVLKISSSKSKTVISTLAVSLLNPNVYLDTVVLIGGASSNLESSARFAFTVGSLSASLFWFFSIVTLSYLLGPHVIRAGLWKKIEGSAGIIMLILAAFMLKSFVINN